MEQLLGGGFKKIESWGKPLRVHLQCSLHQCISHRRGEGLEVFVRFLAAVHASGPVAQGALWNAVFMAQVLERCLELSSLLQSLAGFLLVLLAL